MREKALKFGDIVIKIKFHASKQGIALNLVDTKEIVVSENFKYSDNGFKCIGNCSKYFIGYLDDDDIISHLCIILPRMSGYINFLVMIKNTSFQIEDESVSLEYDEIWNKIKKAHLKKIIVNLFMMKNT